MFIHSAWPFAIKTAILIDPGVFHMRPLLSISRGCVLLLFIATSLIGGCKTDLNDSAIKPIVAADIASQLAGKRTSSTILLDARRRDQYDAGHIPSAANLRLEDVAAGRTRGLAGYSTIIVYGQHPGSASAIGLAKRLMAMGYEGVQLYRGGVDEWTAQGRRLVKSKPTSQ